MSLSECILAMVKFLTNDLVQQFIYTAQLDRVIDVKNVPEK